MNAELQKDVAVYIGRFQPFHNGHLALLNQALAIAEQVIVVIGSANQARTPKNPFTWAERSEMIKLALPEADHARIRFLPIRDYYNEDRWLQAVRAGVEGIVRERTGQERIDVALIGHFKDATSEYLKKFEDWHLVSADRNGLVDGSHIRDAYFGSTGDGLAATLNALSSVIPPTTRDFLRAWAALPFHAELAREWHMLRKYREAWSSAPYPPVFVTVDAVVQCAGKVLLIKRGQPPGVGLYAVPGGFIEARETAYQSAVRELREETRLSLLASTMKSALKSSAVFDHPDRSLRGRTITHAFHFDLGNRPLPEIAADDDAQSADWIDIDQLIGMEDRFHEDHFAMLDHFLGLITHGPQ